jgi:hypothetical protein
MYFSLLLLLPFILTLLAWYILKAQGKDYFGPLQVGIAMGICLLIAGTGLALEFYGVTSAKTEQDFDTKQAAPLDVFGKKK